TRPVKKVDISPPLLGWRCWLGRPARPLIDDPRVPAVVVLLCPVAIDAPGPHRVDGAFHADGTDVDMTDDQRDHQQPDDSVYELRQWHPVVTEPMKRKHQRETACQRRQAAEQDAPEHQLLTGIEAVGRRLVRVIVEESAKAPKPVEVEARDEILAQ